MPAANPKNELKIPLVFFRPAAPPTNVFECPVVTAPAENPRNVLKLEEESILLPPMLYCVAALNISAVPVPEMLKLLDACSSVLL